MANIQEAAEEILRGVIKGWKSRYRCTITVESMKPGPPACVVFRTEWSRRPTPHEPVPDIRVRIRFFVNFVRSPADISFRIEEESLVHKTDAYTSIDHLVLHEIKSKTAIYQSMGLTLQNRTFFGTRDSEDSYTCQLTQEQLSIPFSRTEQLMQKDFDVEKDMVRVFASADRDGNGYLDAAEFEKLLLSLKSDFTAQDVKHIMRAHDKNRDGMLVYKEYIPIALDLTQATQACQYADEVVHKAREEAHTLVAKRLASAPIDNDITTVLPTLDPQNTGRLTQPKFSSLLSSLHLRLKPSEIAAVLSVLSARANSDGTISYQDFVLNHQKILQAALEEHVLDEKAPDLELVLLNLFRKQDRFKTGRLPEATVVDVLRMCDRIRLTTTQLYALMRGTKNDEAFVEYRTFSKKAALMITKLYDHHMVSERNMIIERASVTPIQLLDAKSREQVDKKMRNKFQEFDADNDGKLSSIEFHKCLADTSLSLSRKEIEKLREKADENKDGYVDIDEFLKFSYSTLLTLARDAVLTEKMDTTKKTKNNVSV